MDVDPRFGGVVGDMHLEDDARHIPGLGDAHDAKDELVTWNAFQDGNRLAYLALAIAIGIDSLIFMTGLFGANAVRSPLADVPSSKGRNSQQLEAIVENALLPDTFDNTARACSTVRSPSSANTWSLATLAA